MKKNLLLITLLILNITCTGKEESTNNTNSTFSPTIKNYDKPDIDYDYKILTKAKGIHRVIDKWTLYYSKSLEKILSCEEILPPDNNIGRLEPLYPIIAVYNIFPNGKKKEEYENFISEGYFYCWIGRRRTYVRYGIFKDKKWILCKDINDLKDIFAPITSEREALSYAILATGHRAYFNQCVKINYRYFVKKFSDTFVTKRNNKYYVLLFDNDKQSGCGPFPEYSIEVEVDVMGNITERKKTKVFEDKNMEGLCGD